MADGGTTRRSRDNVDPPCATPAPTPRAGPSASVQRCHRLVRALFAHRTNDACILERHGDADCRPGGGLVGFDPRRQRTQHARPRLVLLRSPGIQGRYPRSGTCPKAQVRLAAAGCLHTAVALELSAGQARAAELTRTQGNPTTLPPPLAARAARADQASNLKSPSVAFGISRPTRTPTRHHRGGEAADRGLD